MLMYDNRYQTRFVHPQPPVNHMFLLPQPTDIVPLPYLCTLYLPPRYVPFFSLLSFSYGQFYPGIDRFCLVSVSVSVSSHVAIVRLSVGFYQGFIRYNSKSPRRRCSPPLSLAVGTYINHFIATDHHPHIIHPSSKHHLLWLDNANTSSYPPATY